MNNGFIKIIWEGGKRAHVKALDLITILDLCYILFFNDHLYSIFLKDSYYIQFTHTEIRGDIAHTAGITDDTSDSMFFSLWGLKSDKIPSVP